MPLDENKFMYVYVYIYKHSLFYEEQIIGHTTGHSTYIKLIHGSNFIY